MNWVCFLALLTPNAAPLIENASPVGADSSATASAWPLQGSWKEKFIEESRIGPRPPRGIRIPAIWVEQHLLVEELSGWGMGSSTVIRVIPRHTGWCLPTERCKVPLRQAVAILSSDLPDLEKGREFAKLINPTMSRDEVFLLLDYARPKHYWCHDKGRLFARVVFVDVGLTISFTAEGRVETVRTGTEDLTACLEESLLAPRRKGTLFLDTVRNTSN